MDYITLKNRVKNMTFVIDYSSNDDVCRVTKNEGAYCIEFFLYYNKEITEYSYATYTSPEEGSMRFTPTEIGEIYVTINQKEFELNDEQLSDLNEVLLEIILNS